MAQGSGEAPLLGDEPCPRSSAAQNRCSTGRALMIAGLISLLCLMTCCSVVTVYTIIHQQLQIESLQQDKIRVSSQIARLVAANTQLGMLIVEGNLNQQEDSSSAKDSQLNDTAVVENLLSDGLQNLRLPQFNGTFSENLPLLKQLRNESAWKSFEAWLQNWLIFQRAQQTPVSNASQSKTKCQMAAEAVVGSYKPQCDAMGHYMPMQCYGSTGYCWCVDDVGKKLPDTLKYGRPDCPNESGITTYDDFIYD